MTVIGGVASSWGGFPHLSPIHVSTLYI